MASKQTLRQQQQGAANYVKQVQHNQHLVTEVADANPHQVIKMVFDALNNHLEAAIEAIDRDDSETADRCLVKSQSVVNSLRASLNYRGNIELAITLNELYEYMGRKIVLAKILHQTNPVNEVINLLQPVREAWEAITDEAVKFYAANPPQESDVEGLSEKG